MSEPVRMTSLWSPKVSGSVVCLLEKSQLESDAEYVRVAPSRRGRRRLPLRPRRVFPARNESLRDDRRGVDMRGGDAQSKRERVHSEGIK